MTRGLAAAAACPRIVLIVAVAVAAVGCGAPPPYKTSESRQLSAARLRNLGRIELDAGNASPASTPRVWIGVPDRRAEGTITGVVVGGAVGAAIGGAAFSGGTGMFAGLFVLFGAFVVGAPTGALVGAPIGYIAGTPGTGARRVSATLRRAAHTVDAAAATREGAIRSSALAKNHARNPSNAGPPGATLSVEVLAFGTRAAGGGRAKPFVAARTRLTESHTGKVLYDTTSDWRGPRRQFHRWDDDGGADFRRYLETGAAELGRRCAKRALTPRKRG